MTLSLIFKIESFCCLSMKLIIMGELIILSLKKNKTLWHTNGQKTVLKQIYENPKFEKKRKKKVIDTKSFVHKLLTRLS